MQKIIKFIAGVRSEVEHIKWPTKNEMIKYSISTIIFMIFFATYFLIIDMIFTLLKGV